MRQLDYYGLWKLFDALGTTTPIRLLTADSSIIALSS